MRPRCHRALRCLRADEDDDARSWARSWARITSKGGGRGKFIQGTISILDDVNLLSPQTRTSVPLPLGPLTTSDVGGLEGEAESSCGHPREAMNLFLARPISRRNRTASFIKVAVECLILVGSPLLACGLLATAALGLLRHLGRGFASVVAEVKLDDCVCKLAPAEKVKKTPPARPHLPAGLAMDRILARAVLSGGGVLLPGSFLELATLPLPGSVVERTRLAQEPLFGSGDLTPTSLGEGSLGVQA